MPVLANNISVIVKTAAIAQKYRGGTEAFTSQCDHSLCDDGELTRVGFATLQEATEFVCKLADRGLSPYDAYKRCAEDMIVASEDRGFAIRCDWAEFGLIDWKGDPSNRVPACRAIGSDSLELSVPESFVAAESTQVSFSQPVSGAAIAV